jgi:hypothetical protein
VEVVEVVVPAGGVVVVVVVVFDEQLLKMIPITIRTARKTRNCLFIFILRSRSYRISLAGFIY